MTPEETLAPAATGDAGRMSPGEIVALDRAHVWHPYAPMPATTPSYLVQSASGVRLRLADGRELVDGMSSWWAAIHGYRHPVLDAAVRDQLDRMSHVMFGGLTHRPAVQLARTLVEIAPAGLAHVFLADSGSVSVEVAVKMCLQYQRAGGRPGRRRLLTWRGGYHGDTFHPMSVCDPEGGMHALWRGVLPEQVFVPAPPAGFEVPPEPAYLDQLAETLAAHRDELAAVIVEPVVQGAGGMRFHHPRYLSVLRELTRAYDILLIFDEIATGFGRTGAMFAADHAGITPDVLCLGKALTGGYLSAAAVLCTPAVARGIGAGPDAGVLAHGPTFMGNPLACAVANASIGLLREEVRAVPGAAAMVGGYTAANLDIQATAQRDRLIVIPLVLGAVLVILMLLLRAVVAPLLLTATVVLSFAAALGVAGVVFRDLLGFAGADSTLPLFAFVFLVALGVDYNIFLMTRVREEVARRGHRAGTLTGLAVTGGVITSAGLVLAATFAALAVLPLVFLAQLAFVVGFGVLLDALVVRTVLVPALTLDLGRASWWPGRLRHCDP